MMMISWATCYEISVEIFFSHINTPNYDFKNIDNRKVYAKEIYQK
jgi:hypothetical protein